MKDIKTIHIDAANGSYDIEIGNGLLGPALLKDAGHCAIVTDENVWALYQRCFPDTDAIVLPPGEETKSMQTLSLLYDRFMQLGLDRSSTVVALGGGVIGDIAGFAAATFKRGIGLLQVPTTLLAQVDSSVGGKTGLNLAGGKNMVGAFYQPDRVAIDVDTLSTLDSRQYAAGMAEVIKYSYIYDEKLHDALQQPTIDISGVVYICCAIKAHYVKNDPFDRGMRMQLNYGHTIGHAIEAAAGYGRLLHGEAVAAGMVYAAAIGEVLGVSPAGLKEDTIRMVERYSLPSSVPPDVLSRALSALSADKKIENGTVQLVLVDKIGHALLHEIQIEEVKNLLTGVSL